MYDFSQSCRSPSFWFHWRRPSRSTWESSPPPRTDGRRAREGSSFESFWKWLSYTVNNFTLSCVLGDNTHELEAMVPAFATICMFLISHLATVWLWMPWKKVLLSSPEGAKLSTKHTTLERVGVWVCSRLLKRCAKLLVININMKLLVDGKWISLWSKLTLFSWRYPSDVVMSQIWRLIHRWPRVS